jgi:serine/threonine-protein kinase
VPQDTGEVVLQVAAALTAIHGVEAFHGGLEPENVFLCKGTEAIQVKLLNFGIAAAKPPKRTSDYVSPEQYLLKPVDYRTDLWSLGVLAYRMLTGECPVSAQKRRLLKWDFTPPSEMWLADIPDEVDQWFERALSKKADARFESAQQMAEEFVRFLPGLETSVGQTEPAAPQVGAHKVIEVGTPESEEEAPASDPDAVKIDVDEEA